MIRLKESVEFQGSVKIKFLKKILDPHVFKVLSSQPLGQIDFLCVKRHMWRNYGWRGRQFDFIRRDVIQASKLQLEDCVSDISPSKEPVMYFPLVRNEGRRNWIELLVCLYLIYRHGNEALYFSLLLLVTMSSLSCNPVIYPNLFHIFLYSFIHFPGCMYFCEVSLWYAYLHLFLSVCLSIFHYLFVYTILHNDTRCME